MHRGFTIVEIALVVTLIAVLTTLGAVGMRQYISDGNESQKQALVAQVQSAMNRYYTENGEYMSAYELRGDGTENPTLPSNTTYRNMATKLNIPYDVINGKNIKLIPTGLGKNMDGNPTNEGDHVFYATRRGNPRSSSGQAFYSGNNNCWYTITSNHDLSISAYILFYWSEAENNWQAVASGKQGLSTTCSYKIL